jgi:recombination protein RecA
MRLDIRRIETLKSQEVVIGSRVRVKVVKNKVASPFQQAEFDLLYAEGISHESNIIDLGITYGLILKSGAWLTYGDEKLGQGRENAKEFLQKDKKITEELEKKIREAAALSAR